MSQERTSQNLVALDDKRGQRNEDSKSEHKLLCLYFVLFILKTSPVGENLTDGLVEELVL